MTRWPIRLRITAAFAAAMGLLLSVVGVAAYRQLAGGLSEDLDRELHQRAEDLSAQVSRTELSLRDLTGTGFIERGESFAEILGTDGAVLQATDTLQGRSLLSPAEVARASRNSVLIDRPHAPGLDEPARLLATPIARGGQRVILVVGNTQENGREALRRVRGQLLVGLPLLLLMTSGLGYLLAGAALRPVEEMRRRAAGLSGSVEGQLLPVPPGNDELARLGATLNALLERVAVTMERERMFVAHASHELRTPLALLRTELELAVRRPRSVVDLTRAIHSAADEVDRLIRLAEDLLLLASIDHDGTRIETERVQVSVLLDRVAARFRSQAARTRRRLVVEPGPDDVVADHHRLELALVNLVSNAFQHGQGEVAIITRSVPGATEFRVTDQGEGPTSAMLAHGFEPFTHNPARGGSGLGLSIVAAVAGAHGGTAGLLNLASGGCAAWIRVPVTGGAPDVRVLESGVVQVARGGSELRGPVVGHPGSDRQLETAMSTALPTRILVLTDAARVAPELVRAMASRAVEDDVQFRLVVLNPARAEVHLLHPERHDKAAEAEVTLRETLPQLEEALGGGRVIGSVSVRHDPMDAVEETLNAEPLEEVWLHVHEHALTRRLHQDLTHRLSVHHLPVRVIEHPTSPVVR